VQTIPIDRVKGFVEVQFEDDGRGVSLEAAVEEVGGIGEALGNAPPKNEPSLVAANKRGNNGLEPACKDFRERLNSTVL
jgi:hypothetical protein